MRCQCRNLYFITAVLMLVGGSVLTPAVAAEQTVKSADSTAEIEAQQYVAYYFHGNLRCGSCRKLEAYSEEAITLGFPEELASGKLAWRPVNTDEKENKHFVKDFELVTKAVVLVEYRGDEVVRFENLKKVWQLVGDRDGFIKYVRDNTGEFIGQD